MPGLIACPGCACHVRACEASCPFCGVTLAAKPNQSARRAAAAVAMGLAASVTLGMAGTGCNPEDGGVAQDGSGGANATSSSSTNPSSDGSGSYTGGYSVVSTYGPAPSVGAGPPPGDYLCDNTAGIERAAGNVCHGCVEDNCCEPTLDCIEDADCRICIFGNVGQQAACDATMLDEAVYACLGASCQSTCGLDVCDSGIYAVGGSACLSCLETACCAEHTACGDDANCTACVNDGDTAACDSTTLDEDLSACGSNSCAAACGP